MTVISFDLDGTLVTDEFSRQVWHKGIPELYAQQYGVGLDEATKLVFQAYDEVGESSIMWYDIRYWLRFFGLDDDFEKLLATFKHLIQPYPEVHDVLSNLKQYYQLIIISNAAREFLDTEIAESNIASYFSHIFSVTTDFKQVKKTEQSYLTICDSLNITYGEMIHIGDHFDFDYRVPKRLGITSFYLDRNGKKEGAETVMDLHEFMIKISNTFNLSIR